MILKNKIPYRYLFKKKQERQTKAQSDKSFGHLFRRLTSLTSLNYGQKSGLVDSKLDSRSEGCGFESCLILH